MSALLGLGALAAGVMNAGVDAFKGYLSGEVNQYFYNRNLASQVSASKELFDYQNAYNTPAKQMQRLADAGLNPNLIYGSSPVGNASMPSAPGGAANPGNFNSKDVIQGVLEMQQVKQSEANINSLDAKAELDRANAEYIKSQNSRYNEVITQNIKESEARIKKTASDMSLNESSIQLNEAKRILAIADEAYRRGEIGLQAYQKKVMTAQIALYMSDKALKDTQSTYFARLANNAKIEGKVLQVQWKYDRIVKSPFMARKQKEAEIVRLKKSAADDFARLGIDGSKKVQWINYLFDRYEQAARIGNIQAKTVQGFIP